MPKNFFQDMVKMKNENRAKLEKKFVISEKKLPPPVEPSYKREPIIEKKVKEYKKEREGTKSHRAIWFVAGACVIFLAFAISLLFSSATITIQPKVQAATLNENLTASKDATNVSDATATNALPFDLVAIPGTETENIKGGTEQDVSIPATGTVFIYNTYSSAPQNLDINTRLEGSNGKMYETKNKVIVPGMKGTTPGKVQVDIYAAAAGPDYNSKPLDFKIFGFKGTPKYAKFYARSTTSIAGGFKGKSLVVSDADKTTAFTDLKTTLQTKLLAQATNQIPSGFILFKDAVFLNIDTETANGTPAADGTIPATVSGTLYGFLFDEAKLTQKIASDVIPNFDGSDVYIPNIRNLTFSLANKDSVSFSDVGNINFSITGAGSIVWRVDQAKLTADVLGKAKKDFNQILTVYPNIDSAQLVISPFWKMSIPSTQSRVKVVVNYPQ